MKFAVVALLATSQVSAVTTGLGAPWNCKHSPTPNNKSTCWADEAYQRCGGGQWAYDAVMKAGGSTQEAYFMLQAMIEGDCASCDVSKANCRDSPTPNNKHTCWADEAFQRCRGSQEAYDQVMGSGGSTKLAYCHLQALIKSDCSILDQGPQVEDKGCWKDKWDRGVPNKIGTGSYCGQKGYEKCMDKAMQKGYNTFSIQWPAGGCECFGGNSPNYKKHGKAHNCNSKGEGGTWANQVYVIQ